MTSTFNCYNNVGNNTFNNTTTWLSVINALIAQLTAYGWVQTADTGQINPTNFTANTNQSGLQGYLIFKPADSLQSTAPLFVRIALYNSDYGDNNTYSPKFALSIGTSTDGAGNLKGGDGTVNSASQVMAVQSYNSVSNNSTTEINGFGSGDTSRFILDFFDDTPNNVHACLIFGVERTKNSSGADTAEGAIMYGYSNRYGGQHMVYSASLSPQAPVKYGWLAPLDPNRTQSMQDQGQNGSVSFTVPTPFAFRPYNPGLMCIVTAGNDIAVGTEVSVAVYSTAHTYLKTGGTAYAVPGQEQSYSAGNFGLQNASANFGGIPMIRYD